MYVYETYLRLKTNYLCRDVSLRIMILCSLQLYLEFCLIDSCYHI